MLYRGMSKYSLGYGYILHAMMNQYISTNNINVDAVAGASEGTGPAMRALIQILDGFISDLNGGN